MRAYCFTACDYREFRVDRIDQATPTKVSVDVVEKTRNTEKINFSIRIMGSSRDVTERFAIPHPTIGSSIELSSYSWQWIQRSVMASGESVLLSTPLEIRAEIAKKARLMLNRYKEA
jgi:proteasome accessory factor C